MPRLLQVEPNTLRSPRGLSVSMDRLGDFLSRRGQPGDAEKALGHYERSLKVREDLLRHNPQSAQTARDVWVSHWRLAMTCERNNTAKAKEHWERAHEILSGMKQRRMFVSKKDERFLERLRAILGW